MTGIKFTLRDMHSDYKFTPYSGPIDLVVTSDKCPERDVGSSAKAIGCYKRDNTYYYAVRTNMNEFTLLEIEYFQIV